MEDRKKDEIKDGINRKPFLKFIGRINEELKIVTQYCYQICLLLGPRKVRLMNREDLGLVNNSTLYFC